MGGKFLSVGSPAEDEVHPGERRDAGEARLWPFGAALGAGFAVAVAGLAGLAWLAWAMLHHPRLPRPGVISLHDAVGVLQLVFASVAGAGALVALIVAYRRQKIGEADSAHDRTRVFNERFTAIASQFGDAQPAVRLAGVHAMAGLADDWKDNRQTCIDVVCAYLRMPYEVEPGDDAPVEKRLAFRASREVRYTVIRVIAAHLNGTAQVSWRGYNLDFTGVVFDGAAFDHAVFSGGKVSFDRAKFSGAGVSFDDAKFSGAEVSFDDAWFSGGKISFDRAVFSGGKVSFNRAKFSGAEVSFGADALVKLQPGTVFSGGRVSFNRAEFSSGKVSFGARPLHGAEFSGGWVSFDRAKFSGAEVFFGGVFSGAAVSFDGAEFSGGRVFLGPVVSDERVTLIGAKFSGAEVWFGAWFTGGLVTFHRGEFSSGKVSFAGAEFRGGDVFFGGATFSGSNVDFSRARDWSHPPDFDAPSPPPGVKLPPDAGHATGQSHAHRLTG
jgi:uncharacterized protein YjbI with pentapeptide repeats